jgi:TM2 domain-containing membrane protein YozV
MGKRQPRMVPSGKSKLLAAGMSIVVPGSGQFYNGKYGWGVAQLALALGGLSMAYLGYYYSNQLTYSLGGLTMTGASVWSGFDSWFSTIEEVPER